MIIVIIGTGALGKRHLSSVLQSAMKLDVFCYDVNPRALEGFEWEDIYHNKTLKAVSNFDELPKTVDFALFAMTAGGRREMFDQLVASCDVRNILFEKVLFQRTEDYEHVGKKLEELGIHAWVNCSRRQMDCFRNLRDALAEAKEMAFTVTGGEWGMACNAIHELDLVAFLSGSDDLQIHSFKLIPGIFDSKRQGYKEVYGTISGSCGRCREFTINCMKGTEVPDIMMISSDIGQYYILEGKKRIISMTKKNGYELRDEPFEMPYQSQMTQFVMEEILNRGTSRLATYEESAKLHLVFLKPLMDYFYKNGWEGDACPIT